MRVETDIQSDYFSANRMIAGNDKSDQIPIRWSSGAPTSKPSDALAGA
jgi:hypothetical protein